MPWCDHHQFDPYILATTFGPARNGPYPGGSEVEIYYHPTRPPNAILQPGVNALSFFPLTLGGAVIVRAILAIADCRCCRKGSFWPTAA